MSAAACGFPVDTRPYVDRPFFYLFRRSISNQVLTDLRQVIGKHEFHLKGIQIHHALGAALLARFRWPDGVYSAPSRFPASDLFSVGRDQYWLDDAVLCPPLSFIGIELEASAVSGTVSVLFSGFQRLYQGAQ